jgi:hypothetical protein
MHRASALPVEFAAIADRVHYVREVVHGSEWAGSCPSCGGEIHRNGEWPDRCRFWPHSTRAGGKPLAWCRSCGWKWTPKKEVKVDPAKLEEMKRAREKAEAEHERAQKQARAAVQREHKWEVYHNLLMNTIPAQDAWIAALGVDQFKFFEMAEYWKLGCSLKHEFWVPNGGERIVVHTSNTLTVPVTDLNGKCINIKHRLTKPGADGVRYRQEYRGTGEAVFIANRQLMNRGNWAVIAEGEKKAMVAWTLTGPNMKLQVFGMPASPSLKLMESIKAEHIVYIPDPDVFEKEMMINRAISVWARRDFRIVKLPDKLDDFIIANKPDPFWLLAMFKLPTWFESSRSGHKWSEYK